MILAIVKNKLNRAKIKVFSKNFYSFT